MHAAVFSIGNCHVSSIKTNNGSVKQINQILFKTSVYMVDLLYFSRRFCRGNWNRQFHLDLPLWVNKLAILVK